MLKEALGEIDPSLACLEAGNGQEGFEVLKQSGESLPSLIFLDLNMPKINGRQFMKLMMLQEQLKDLPVIVYTTSASSIDRIDLEKAGAASFLVKPSEYALLIKNLLPIYRKFFPQRKRAGLPS